ncbi:MAG: Hsp20/alpha crystallin family protein [Lachnospiraceae bacterium]|nr:Hsp20/alpha crystallin family protein [Lachnospiraceae bacterium]
MMERRNDLMRSDLRENEEAYFLDIDLPGCAKDKIQAYVENEYLTVEADFRKEETAKTIRRERYAGRCQRRFYVGEIRTQDIQAAYKDGVLTLTIPKKAYERAEEERRITIE